MSLRERIDLKKHLRDAESDSDGEDVFGDSSDTALATSALAEALQMAGKVGAASQKKNEDVAADKKAKDAADAAVKKHDADVQVATDARNAATKAKMAAAGETDVNGPLHYLAVIAEQKATVAEAKAGSGMSTGGSQQQRGGGSGMPVWGWAALGIAAAGLLTTTVVLAVRKKR